ncbi:MAG: NAD-dependent epimerase/dehydratase family protein [Acidimicrobiales bacterium]
MRVLVMGGSLFNGRSLVNELVAAGHDTTVCNRGRTPAQYPPGVDVLVADRTDHDALRSVLGGSDWDAVVDMTAYHPADVEVMIDLLDGHVGHYVFISSTVTYATGMPCPITENAPDDRGPDQNEYGLHKLLCEDVLNRAFAERAFPATTVMLSMVFGPHNALPDREQRMFARMEQGRPILIPGDGTTQGIVGHVDDQSRALIAVLGVDAALGKRFNCTGNDAHTDNRYVDVFAAVVGVDVERVPIGPAVMDDLWDGRVSVSKPSGSRPTMDIRATSEAAARARAHAHRFQLGNITQRLQPNLHRWDTDVVFSIEALQSATGWSPDHDFESAVEHTYRWWVDSRWGESLDFDFGWEDDIVALLR